MKLDERFLDDLKGRVRLSDVVGRVVKLRKQGKEYAGLSPFAKERTPSFFVNDEKGFFHCFSSGKHGDVLDFLKETQGLDFMEAVRMLADQLGMQLPTETPEAAEAERRRRGLEDWLQLAQSWFEAELRRPGGQEAREYLERRGLGEADWARFGVGLAPAGRTALKDYLVAKGAMPAQLIEAGLLIEPEDGSAPFDRFRGRITFPICDSRGRLVSFGGRALDPGARAKYLNGPDTPIFDKGQHLYGLDLARQLLAKGPAPLVMVEGYMDVIACHRAGVPACAPMGTSLTESQLALLWRFSPDPILCFDADAAGRRAAARAIDLALPHLESTKTLRFTRISGGKDPDDVLREQGAEALRAQLSVCTGLVQAIFRRERDAMPLDTPERRANLRKRLREVMRAVGDRDLAREFGAELSRLATEHLTRGQRGPVAAQEDSVEAARRLREAAPPVAAALAYWAVHDPSRIGEHLEAISEFGFGHASLDPLAAELVHWAMEAPEPEPEALAQALHARGLGAIIGALTDPGRRFEDPTTWATAYGARVEYISLCKATEAAKTQIKSPDDMKSFLALKAQRDAAKHIHER